MRHRIKTLTAVLVISIISVLLCSCATNSEGNAKSIMSEYGLDSDKLPDCVQVEKVGIKEINVRDYMPDEDLKKYYFWSANYLDHKPGEMEYEGYITYKQEGDTVYYIEHDADGKQTAKDWHKDYYKYNSKTDTVEMSTGGSKHPWITQVGDNSNLRTTLPILFTVDCGGQVYEECIFTFHAHSKDYKDDIEGVFYAPGYGAVIQLYWEIGGSEEPFIAAVYPNANEYSEYEAEVSNTNIEQSSATDTQGKETDAPAQTTTGTKSPYDYPSMNDFFENAKVVAFKTDNGDRLEIDSSNGWGELIIDLSLSDLGQFHTNEGYQQDGIIGFVVYKDGAQLEFMVQKDETGDDATMTVVHSDFPDYPRGKVLTLTEAGL